MEKRGVHTVTIAWDTFEKAARTAARVQGVPKIELAIIPHRKGGETADDQRRKAEDILPEIVRKLLKRADP
ncbi:MAG TPA: hypothetical protein PKA20_04030 [Burkholderiaceae bacterium]|nr:hypothetical protein [Burkholderiaceae bacterium]